MFYYDPMGKGIQNETVIKLFKVFFELFYKCNKTCDIEIESKGFIKDFDVIWEEKFPSQKDSCSCGVFILMYMSYHLGLLTFDPDVQSISKIRNEMAKELFLGLKNYPVFPNTETGPMSKRCVTATRYKQHQGKNVVLYCSVSTCVGKTFSWTFNGITVSNEQEYAFELTEDKVSTYCCRVLYQDGKSYTSSCIVECQAHAELVDNKTLMSLVKKAIQENFGRK